MNVTVLFGIDIGQYCVEKSVMRTDPKECLEYAKRCMKLAAETTDPVLKDSLLYTAQRWERLAAELESDNEWLAMQARPLKRSA